MNEEDLLDLIEKELSGGLTADERDRLRVHLETDPEARRLHRHMIETGDALKEIRDVDVPAGLKQRIMNSIDARRYRAHGRIRAELPLWRRIIIPRIRLVYAFAVGVLVGAVVYSQMIPRGPASGPSDAIHLYGLIAGRQVRDLVEVDSVSLDLPGVRGEIRLMRGAGLAVLKQELSSDMGLEVKMIFDPQAMRFEGFRIPDDTAFRGVSEDGWLEVEGDGRRTYVMTILDQKSLPSDIRVEVLVSGEAVYTTKFAVDRWDES
jgi:hypothetical protein